MGVQDKDPLAQLSLPPGFRFYPTDEELLVQYLCKKVAGHHFSLQIIADIDLYKFDPWDLPSKAMFGEKEWYFFSPRDRKYPNGSRPNRVAGSGYWKATGTDKIITTQGRKVGIKKALVFYIGKAPKGTKTNWIMHEYRLTEPTRKNGSSKLDDWVLCRIYKKSTGTAKPDPSKEHSAGGSISSSSSQFEDVLPDIADPSFTLPRMNSLLKNQNSGYYRQQQQEADTKFALQHLGSGNFDWSVLAGLAGLGDVSGLTQKIGQGNDRTGIDNFVPDLPPLSHVESGSPVDNKFADSVMTFDDEVQSGVTSMTTQRVNSNSNVLTRGYYSNTLDPFGGTYTNQQSVFGFGFGL